jgi:cellulose synthase/poly-beta-1,6-N-acetylglucosamine synthase-like glycosyltransferase
MIALITMITVVILLLWTAYNTPSYIVGFKQLIKAKNHRKELEDDCESSYNPKISIIIPVKNEEKVIGRLLTALMNTSYANKEIIVVEGGSTDKTQKICQEWSARYPSIIRFFKKNPSDGKPSAINYGAERATGEIIALYDADTIVEPDTFEKVVSYFKDPNVTAVQGELYSINPNENIVTRLSVLNDFITHVQQVGKDKLDLFVPLLGTNQYIKRSVLNEIGYWDPKALSEDSELSVKLLKKGYAVKYVPVRAGVEAPAKLTLFMKQRMRWFRGYVHTMVKHWDILKIVNKKRLDAQLTLLFPLMLIIGLTGYVEALYNLINANLTSQVAGSFISLIGLFLFVLSLLTPLLVTVDNPRNSIYVPLLYLNWIVLAVVSLCAYAQVILCTQQKWTKTEKSGNTT